MSDGFINSIENSHNGNDFVEIDMKDGIIINVNCNHLENKKIQILFHLFCELMMGHKLLIRVSWNIKNDIENIAKHVCYCCVLHTKFVLYQNHISKDSLLFYKLKN